MNDGWIKTLLQRCQAARVWPQMRTGAGIALSYEHIAFIVFADHVENWIRELERIEQALRNPQREDYDPQRKWTPQAWIAYYDGRLAAIDIESTGQLASIGATDRDATPRFIHFRNFFDEVCKVCWKLKEENGLTPPGAGEDVQPTPATPAAPEVKP